MEINYHANRIAEKLTDYGELWFHVGPSIHRALIVNGIVAHMNQQDDEFLTGKSAAWLLTHVDALVYAVERELDSRGWITIATQ